MASEEEEVSRSVFNILDLLAKVGGLYEILNIFASFITWRLRENLYILSIISSLYHRKDDRYEDENWPQEKVSSEVIEELDVGEDVGAKT